MPRGFEKVAGGEKAAFEKLAAALRHGQEACAELSAYTSDTRWNQVAILLQRMHTNVHSLRVKRTSGVSPPSLILPN